MSPKPKTSPERQEATVIETPTRVDTTLAPFKAILEAMNPEDRAMAETEISETLKPIEADLKSNKREQSKIRRRLLTALETLGHVLLIPLAGFIIGEVAPSAPKAAQGKSETTIVEAAPAAKESAKDSRGPSFLNFKNAVGNAGGWEHPDMAILEKGPSLPSVIDIAKIHPDLTPDDFRLFFSTLPDGITREIAAIIGKSNKPKISPDIPIEPMAHAKGGVENPGTPPLQATIEVFPDSKNATAPELMQKLFIHESAHCADMFTSSRLTEQQRIELLQRLLDRMDSGEPHASALVEAYMVNPDALRKVNAADLLIRFRTNQLTKEELNIVNKAREIFAEDMTTFLLDLSDEMTVSAKAMAHYYMTAIHEANWNVKQNAVDREIGINEIISRNELAKMNNI